MLLDTIFCLVSLFSLIISPGKEKKLKRTHDTRMVTDLSFCEDNARPRTRISAGNENIVSGRKSRKMEQEINTTQTTKPWGQKKKNGKRDNWLRELSFTGRVNKDSASERQRKSNTLSEKCTPQKKEKAREGKWKESNQIKTSLLIQCYFSSLQSLSSPRLSSFSP